MQPDPQSVSERLGWRPRCRRKCQKRCFGWCGYDAGDADYAQDVGRLPMGSAPGTAPLLLQAYVGLETLVWLQGGWFVQAALGDLGLRMMLWVLPLSMANAS